MSWAWKCVSEHGETSVRSGCCPSGIESSTGRRRPQKNVGAERFRCYPRRPGCIELEIMDTGTPSAKGIVDTGTQSEEGPRAPARPPVRPRRIVILGGGFAGAYCAQQLEKELRNTDVQIWLLDRNNYFVFYPLLVEAGTGSLEPRHAVVSLRSFLKRTEFRMAEILDVEPKRQRVHYHRIGAEEHAELGYDHLVIALGSVTRLPNVPGLAEHGFQLKGLADAVALRDRAIRMLEIAAGTSEKTKRERLLHVVIVGANFTGVEIAGEFLAFLREASRRYPNIDPRECQVTLVERSERILGALDADLADYAKRQMERRGMRVLIHASAQEIRADAVVLTNGEVLPSCTTIWCAGIAPPEVLREVGLPLDPLGYLLCESDQRVLGCENVWAIGDCSIQRSQEGHPLPATAQRAVQEGKHLAKNLRRVLLGQQPQAFRYSDRGALAALGCRTAVAKVFGVKLSGFFAWFLWRTVYLYKMPGWSRRLRVALDWTADLFFRRDYVQLGLHRRSAESGDGRVEANAGRDRLKA